MELSGRKRILVGYELGNEVSRISYYGDGMDDVATVSVVSGEEAFSIPTFLCKRKGVNQWFFGNEALKYQKEVEGIGVGDLLEKFKKDEPVLIEEGEYRPVALLSLFIKRTLGLINSLGSIKNISDLVITVKEENEDLWDILKEAVDNLGISDLNLKIQTNGESFFHYMMHEDASLRGEKVILFKYDSDVMEKTVLDYNKKTKPVVAYIQKESFPFNDTLKEEAGTLDSDSISSIKDGIFNRICEASFKSGDVKATYLIGDRFNSDWLDKSLKTVCGLGRRAFMGNNLFSKGACLYLKDLYDKEVTEKEFVFLGNGKLKSNIGMEVYRQGELSYFAILDAGTDTKEAVNDFDIYVQDKEAVKLIITSLSDGKEKRVSIVLEDYDDDCRKINVKCHMIDDETVEFTLTDMGLGELIESTKREWREKITL
ncbi:MAG: hypothetical protein K6F84_05760 [Lachnospiraceae bacterium]|nr:hypothetical protein [Lachnospiraceae bacterium]